jgi:class 3 adenylate cyclase
VFNTDPDNPISDKIQVRIALDTGKIKYSEDTGRIVSDTINFAAHLEKQATPADGISVSEDSREQLPDNLKTIFWNEEEFEGRAVYQVCIPGLQ